MATAVIVQSARFDTLTRQQLADCIDRASTQYCEIFNVSDPRKFLNGAIDHLAQDVSGDFVLDDVTAIKTLPSMAEFVVWHLLLRLLEDFEEDFSCNAQEYKWFSTGSPNSIDITALRQVDGMWRFYAIEVKWSEQCDYYGQVRQGLVRDIDKLHRADYSSFRLGTHITAMKPRLRKILPPEKLELIFSGIRAGSSPEETEGVEFWGFFVSDWHVANQTHDPNDHFAKLACHAEAKKWPQNTVRGFMLNIEGGKELLKKLSRGDNTPCSP